MKFIFCITTKNIIVGGPFESPNCAVPSHSPGGVLARHGSQAKILAQHENISVIQDMPRQMCVGTTGLTGGTTNWPPPNVLLLVSLIDFRQFKMNYCSSISSTSRTPHHLDERLRYNFGMRPS